MTERVRGRGGDRLTAIERAERARAIARARAQGVPWPQIADEHGITVRHAHRLAAQVAEGGDPRAREALLQPAVEAPADEPQSEVLAPIPRRRRGINPFVAEDVWAPLHRLLEAVEWSATVMRREADKPSPNPARVGAAKQYAEMELVRARLLNTVGAMPSDPCASSARSRPSSSPGA